LLAGKEAQEGPPLAGRVIPDCAAQHGIAGFESIEHRTLGYRPLNLKLHFTSDVRQSSQMKRQYDTDHVA
jgi:hypothetical protein